MCPTVAGRVHPVPTYDGAGEDCQFEIAAPQHSASRPDRIVPDVGIEPLCPDDVSGRGLSHLPTTRKVSASLRGSMQQADRSTKGALTVVDLRLSLVTSRSLQFRRSAFTRTQPTPAGFLRLHSGCASPRKLQSAMRSALLRRRVAGVEHGEDIGRLAQR